jgi:hypothetical protein
LVEQHLCQCPQCQVSIEIYQTTITISRTLPHCDERLSAEFEARLRAVLEAEGFR